MFVSNDRINKRTDVQHSVTVALARAWNSLPSSVRNAPSLSLADDVPSPAEDCTFSVVV